MPRAVQMQNVNICVPFEKMQGTSQCSCRSGFDLAPDGRSCVGMLIIELLINSISYICFPPFISLHFHISIF
ncbi:unnamed protein product [Meloidogyne enterolobii]|uniref:Uncharacterized protein n=1 Tax=Meloidogyne enterolobii TaxID=390850 RepID=A0ACB0ZZ72_MELEN